MYVNVWSRKYGIGMPQISWPTIAYFDNALIIAHRTGKTSLTVETDEWLQKVDNMAELQELIDLFDGTCWWVTRSPKCTRVFFDHDEFENVVMVAHKEISGWFYGT